MAITFGGSARAGRVLFACIAWIALVAPGAARAAHLTGTSATYTTDADFDEGVSLNVVHSTPDQLQLDDESKPFPFIWVAVSTKGTVVKIDTKTGKILGEYYTAPSGMGRDPSRTTVDKNGSVWLSNRAESGYVPSMTDYMGSIVHIGLKETGTCEDRDGDGTIQTSSAQNDILSWTNTGAADTYGGVSTASDECILNYVRVHAYGTRHISVTKDNDIWVSGTGSPREFDLVDGDTGEIIRSEPGVSYGGYGGLIDENGVIWSAAPMLRWDTANPLTGPSGANWRGYSHPSYGLCIDSQGNVYNTEYGSTVRKFSPDGTLVASFTHGSPYAQGCVVGENDDLWVAGSLSNNVVDHLKSDGTYVGSIRVGSGPTGVAVDSDGKIWATNYISQTVSRIDPSLNGGIGAVDLTTVGLGGSPYNYSDMTGSTLIGAPNRGTWTVVHDSGADDTEWGQVTWTADAPGDAQLTTTVASSTDGVTFGAGQTLTAGGRLTVPAGRYLRVQMTFLRASTGKSPILYDLTISPIATALVAYPALAEVGPNGLWIDYSDVSARLSEEDTDDPIAGREIDFYTQGRFLCSGITNNLGIAQCGGLTRSINVILGNGYQAVFEGDARYLRATADGALIGGP